MSPAYRMSNDGITWSSTVTTLSASYVAAEGWDYQTGASAQSVSTDQKLLQFGFLVKNTTGEQVEMCQGRLRLEIAPRADLRGGSELELQRMPLWDRNARMPVLLR